MRLVAALEMDACKAELELGGEVVVAGTRTRITLRAAGQAPLRQELRRETATPPMAQVLQAAVASWRFPFVLALEPLAGDAAALLQQAGPLTGALVGEAGLRPCTHGSSGWEWFVGLRVEPAAVPLQLVDPLLGSSRQTLDLLPALVLVDWSLG
jgi:hypothetical protein